MIGKSGRGKRPDSRKALGDRAERLAEEHLRKQGLEILGRNVRAGRFEVDLVARDDNVVVIVEVRSRSPGAWVTPLGSIDAKKRARISVAAQLLWNRHFARDPSAERLRFDVVAVTFDTEDEPRVEHVRAAFTTSERS